MEAWGRRNSSLRPDFTIRKFQGLLSYMQKPCLTGVGQQGSVCLFCLSTWEWLFYKILMLFLNMKILGSDNTYQIMIIKLKCLNAVLWFNGILVFKTEINIITVIDFPCSKSFKISFLSCSWLVLKCWLLFSFWILSFEWCLPPGYAMAIFSVSELGMGRTAPGRKTPGSCLRSPLLPCGVEDIAPACALCNFYFGLPLNCGRK